MKPSDLSVLPLFLAIFLALPGWKRAGSSSSQDVDNRIQSLAR